MRTKALYFLITTASLVVVTGCTAWRPRANEGAPVPTDLRGDLRVTRKDNSIVLLNSAAVVNDSIVGTAQGSATRIAIATSEVRTVERREIDKGKTAGMMIIGSLGVLAAVFLLLADVTIPVY